MARPALTPARGRTPDEPAERIERDLTGSLFDERELRELEQAHAEGVTSKQIIDLFEGRGLHLSEATLRKYVQQGLLPRSHRVGRKGKHSGSCGLYPAVTIRRINAIKRLMSESFTIEEIQRQFGRFKDDVAAVERGMHALLQGFGRELESRKLGAAARRAAEREIEELRRLATELLRRIEGIERALVEPQKPGAEERKSAVEGAGESW